MSIKGIWQSYKDVSRRENAKDERKRRIKRNKQAERDTLESMRMETKADAIERANKAKARKQAAAVRLKKAREGQLPAWMRPKPKKTEKRKSKKQKPFYNVTVNIARNKRGR